MLRACFLLLLLICSSCARMPDRKTEEKKYQLQGVIVRLDPQLQSATIKHGEIVGWMEAMTMEFPVASKDEFARLKEGQTIRATVTVRGFDFSVGGIQIDTP